MIARDGGRSVTVRPASCAAIVPGSDETRAVANRANSGPLMMAVGRPTMRE